MKERLTGAIILVALIVCLVPELLKGPIHSAPRPMDASLEGSPLKSIEYSLSDDTHTRSEAVPPAGPPAPHPLAAQPAATEPPASPPQQREPVAPPAAAPSTPAAAPAVRGQTPAATAPHAPAARAASSPAAEAPGWLVQVGSFAQRGNAEHLAQQLRAQGFNSSVSRSAKGRHLYRVRVGPVHDKAAATQLATKLHAAGHSGAVVPR